MAKIPAKTLRALFAFSAGQCMFPGCQERMLDDGTPLTQVAHISSVYPGGPRHSPTLTDAEQLSFDNLMLFCSAHHKFVDANPERFSASVLLSMKKDHEKAIASSIEVRSSTGSEAVSQTLQKHSSKLGTLRKVLKVWNEEMGNSSEEFWHVLFAENPIILAYAVGGGPFVLDSKCYLGGKSFDNKGGKIVDFAARYRGSVDLIEIKTPVAKLVGSEYRRGIFTASRELLGACAQVVEYRQTMLENLHTMKADTPDLEAACPACWVIIGNLQELSRSELRSLELYRRTLKDVTVLTFSEVFDNIRNLVDMLSE